MIPIFLYIKKYIKVMFLPPCKEAMGKILYIGVLALAENPKAIVETTRILCWVQARWVY